MGLPHCVVPSPSSPGQGARGHPENHLKCPMFYPCIELGYRGMTHRDPEYLSHGASLGLVHNNLCGGSRWMPGVGATQPKYRQMTISLTQHGKRKKYFYLPQSSPLTIPKIIILRSYDCRRTPSHCVTVTMCNIWRCIWGCVDLFHVLLIQGIEILSLCLSSPALAKGRSSHILVAGRGHLPYILDAEQ